MIDVPKTEANRVRAKAIIAVLLTEDSDVHARDEEGKTLLHHAAIGDYRAAIKKLVTMGAFVGATDNEGKTPLHHAARGYSYIDNEGKTHLRYLGRGHRGKDEEIGDYRAAIKKLIQLGAPVGATDNKGNTALTYWLESKKNDPEIEILLSQDISPQTVVDDNRTTLLL